MTYRATIGSAMGLYATGGLAAAILFYLGLASPVGRLSALLIGTAVVALLIAVRVRYLVRVTPDELRSRSLLRDMRIKWQEIVRVAPAEGAGYWTSRFAGPYVLEFASPNEKLRVNFKMFSRRCMEDVLSHLPPGLW